MDPEVRPWKMAFFQLPWSDFLRNQFIEPSRFLLGVNWMWTMHQNVNVFFVFYFIIRAKKAVVKNEFKFDHYLGFTCLLLASFLFRLLSSWFWTSMVIVREWRRSLIFLVGLYMFLCMLVKRGVDIQGLLLQGKWENFAILSLVYVNMGHRQECLN